MPDESEVRFDLFGEVICEEKGGRGRPAHVATDEKRNKVMLLLAMGWANKRIADALECSLPTLKKHYFSVLQLKRVAADRLKATRFEMLFSEMQAGNVTAMKEFDRMHEREMMILSGQRFTRIPTTPKKGKKETASDAARTAGKNSSWDDLLNPGGQAH